MNFFRNLFGTRDAGESSIRSAPENHQSPGPISGTPAMDFEVFVNFRGADVRTNLIDVLRYFMEGAGIRHFYDDGAMHLGDEIGPELLRGIEKAHVYLAVLSERYAESKWCLKELAHMVECEEEGKHGHKLIVPVFYRITVDDVKIRDGVDSMYKSALNGLEARPEDKKKWEAALRKVTAIKGIEIGSSTGINKVSQEIVEELWFRLKTRHLGCHLVGTYEEAQELEKQLAIESGDVRFLVIHGNRGTGKTTLARAVFAQISDRFQGSSFLRDIREMSDRYGLEFLKHKLLRDICGDHYTTKEDSCRDKKVLIVLDDVDKWRQIEVLAGSSAWFGPGSRILITLSSPLKISEFPISIRPHQAITLLLSQRFEDKSQRPKISEWCISNQPLHKETNKLNDEQARELFSRYAFGEKSPLDSLKDLSYQIVGYCEGLPLVLEVMGSLLRRERNDEKWRTILESLKNCGDVKEKLKISYDALSGDRVRSAFLDIACFFVNEGKTNPTYMWNADRPEEGLEELLMSSLVKIVDGDKLWMHDYLRNLGRDIVTRSSSLARQQCCLGRCRYWIYSDALEVLRCVQDTSVEAICLYDLPAETLNHKARHWFLNLLCQKVDAMRSYDQQPKPLKLEPQNFSNKTKLRFLKLHSMEFEGNFEGRLTSLRWLSWHKVSKHFKATKLASTSLVILDLAQSLIDDEWAGWKNLEGKLNLRVIDLTCCQNLTRMPDFCEFKNLERLILEDCRKLANIGSSIGKLTNLKFLNVKGCDSLNGLPKEIGSLKALKEILISKKHHSPFSLPDEIGNLTSLTILEIVNVEMTSYPKSIGRLLKLQRLSMLRCSGIKEPEIGKLTSLVNLEMSGTQVTSLPESIGHLKELKVLKMERSELTRLPNAIWKVAKLEELHARDSKDLEGTIPDEIGELKNLRILDLSGTKVEKLSDTISKLSHLQKLQLPPSCESPDWSKLPKNLTDLGIQYQPPLPQVTNMDKLEKLELHVPDDTNHQTTSSVSTTQLKSLCLSCKSCKNLQDLQCCSFLQSSLSKLILERVKVHSASPHISNMENLTSLELRDCELSDVNKSRSSQPQERRQDAEAILFDNKLRSLEHFSASYSRFRIIRELRPPEGLRVLYFKECDFVDSKLQLSGLKYLKQLTVSKCPGLTHVEGLGNLENLEELRIHECENLAELCGDISKSKKLRVIRVLDNNQLIRIEGIEKVPSKDKEYIVWGTKLPPTRSRRNTTDHRDRCSWERHGEKELRVNVNYTPPVNALIILSIAIVVLAFLLWKQLS